MQEDIERRTVALSINATKLTGRALAKILGAAVRKIQKDYQKGQAPQGKQSVKKLMNHGVSTAFWGRWVHFCKSRATKSRCSTV